MDSVFSLIVVLKCAPRYLV